MPTVTCTVSEVDILDAVVWVFGCWVLDHRLTVDVLLFLLFVVLVVVVVVVVVLLLLLLLLPLPLPLPLPLSFSRNHCAGGASRHFDEKTQRRRSNGFGG